LDAAQIISHFIENLQTATPLEYIAVVTGIASVYFSRKENILVYPVGLINTTIYTYLSFAYHLPGEASVNFYYTVMSLYGWYMWVKKNPLKQKYLHITYSSRNNLISQFAFFAFIYLLIFGAEIYLEQGFYPGVIPWADALASATAFTAMWLMTRKKVESWYWWIATNVASVPLYMVKGLSLTSLYYIILLIFAFFGLKEWRERANHAKLAA
jgi:nicotinamide mononucleotide transporter